LLVGGFIQDSIIPVGITNGVVFNLSDSGLVVFG